MPTHLLIWTGADTTLHLRIRGILVKYFYTHTLYNLFFLRPHRHMHLPCGLAKLEVCPIEIPRDEGDGVGPNDAGEGARRAPLGEFAAWMFPAHNQLLTHHTLYSNWERQLKNKTAGAGRWQTEDWKRDIELFTFGFSCNPSQQGEALPIRWLLLLDRSEVSFWLQSMELPRLEMRTVSLH